MALVSRLKSYTHNQIGKLAGYFGSESANYPRHLAVHEPNQGTIDFLRTTSAKMVAEIGIYRGHTSLEIAKFLNGEGELHLYDYADRVSFAAATIAEAGFHNVKTFGSSYKLMDSYNWPLARMIEQNQTPIYDYIFQDGAHTFPLDALAFFLADRLLKIGGHMDFDDYNWTLGESAALKPSRFPLTGRSYTSEQIETKQVKMIIDLLVRRSGRYIEVVENKIFRKTAS
jgi:O-methyltransferase